MSRLSDLLNPAPNSPGSPTRPSVTEVDRRTSAHSRYPSLSSPLEALALAASNSPSDAKPANQELQRPNCDNYFAPSNHHPSTTHNSRALGPLVPATSSAPTSTTSETPNHHQHTPQEDSLRLTFEEPRSVPGITSHIHPAIGNDTHSTLRDGPSMTTHSNTKADTTEPGIRNNNSDLGLPTMKEEPADGNETMDHEKQPGVVGEGGDTPNHDELSRATGIVKKEETPTAGLQMDGILSEPSTSALPTSEGKPKGSTPASRKKGTASAIKKPAPKKRKIEAVSKDGTPVSQRSTTPTSSRASKTPAPKNRKQQSATPALSATSPAAEEDEEDGEESSEVFCICRKPDDHTWMIGCDGGCEDWFHGRCVNIDQRDENLIDKYICPNCSAKGAGVTTWKPMCRLDTCRSPARSTGPNPSKYCSDAHGELYMRQRVLGKGAQSAKPPAKKKRKEDHAAATEDGDAEEQDDPAHLRGGILKPGELRALVSGVDSIVEFKKLGDPISNTSVAIQEDKGDGDDQDGGSEPSFTANETERMENISQKKDALQKRLESFSSRQRFAEIVRSRAKGVLEELKKREKALKDICGYDARLSWSDAAFDNWRTSDEGKSALETGNLGPPSRVVEDAEGDTKMTDGEGSGSDDFGAGVCQKKRCERHKQWYKLQMNEVTFEKEECRQEKARLDQEEKGIRERAMLRGLEERH